MEIHEIRAIAIARGVRWKGMGKAELVRAIQRAEGTFDCFATVAEEECDVESCIWREDCLAEAMLEEMMA